MYNIIRNENEEEGFNVYFDQNWICGYATLIEAQDAIKRLKAHAAYEQAQECYSYAGPSRSPSNVWDGLYWAD